MSVFVQVSLMQLFYVLFKIPLLSFFKSVMLLDVRTDTLFLFCFKDKSREISVQTLLSMTGVIKHLSGSSMCCALFYALPACLFIFSDPERLFSPINIGRSRGRERLVSCSRPCS